MKRRFGLREAYFLLAAAFLLSGLLHPIAAVGQVTLGRDVLVGSFEIQVQIVQQQITVRERGGVHAAAVSATSLSAEFADWDPATRIATIDVVVENVGETTLFGPLEARVVKLVSPATTLMNPDFATGWRWAKESLHGQPFLPIGFGSAERTLRFTSADAMAFKLDVEIFAGVPLTPGQGATLEGPGGVRLTVSPDSVPYETLIDIRPVATTEIEAPLGELTVAGSVEVNFERTEIGLVPPPSKPFTITIPDPVLVYCVIQTPSY